MAEVDTSKAEHRTLRFTGFGDLRRELDAIETAHRAGTLRTTGNWTAGQVFGHVGSWMSYPYEGYPDSVGHPPWIVRTIVRIFMRNRFFNGVMPAGVKIPGVQGGTVGQEPVSFEEGMDRLRQSIDRMERQPPTTKNPLFGELSTADWMNLNLRHAELHLGFLQVR